VFQNYLKTVLRSFSRNKTFSFINVFGLTIGLTSCLLIALYIQQQLSFDDFQQNGNRIARVVMEYSFEGSDAGNKGTFTSVRVPMVLKQNFPEVKDATIMTLSKKIVHYNNNVITENHFMYADSSFFNIFSFPLLTGDKRTVLANPHSIVLTQSTAKKYFGNADAVGKTLQVTGDSNLYKITGIAADCPANSQLQFDFIASFSTLGITPDHYKSYWDANYTTYILLNDKNAINSLQAKMPAFMQKEMEGQHATVNFYFEPFNSIHLYSPYDAFAPNVSVVYIYILAGVAILILVIACFTYINLSTARSVERAKEISIRKVAGAQKNQIFWQFIGEAAVVCFIAVLLALICAVLLLPYFSRLTNQQLHASSLFSLPVLCVAIGIIIIVSFAAGSYPALVLSSFQPAKVLKGAFKNAASGQLLRKSLIVFQFVISVFLIVSTFIIQQQLYFIQHKKLGYDREHLLVLPVSYGPKNIDLIKTEFKQNADVKNVALCYNTPVNIVGGYNMRKPEMPENSQVAVTANPVDDEFLPAAGLQLVAGNNLTQQDLKDVSVDDNSNTVYHFILNESAAKQLGWSPQEAVGKKMFLDESRPGYVSGVVKDFNFQSLRNPIKPVVLFSSPYGNTLLVKINSAHIRQTIAFLQNKWKELVPDRPFDYRFLDDDYNKLYDNELRLGKIMNIFAAVAIILACIGLFGLSAYAAQQRVKEIGVRKVLGASISNIVFVLSKDFLKLAFIATLIAFPVAWWAMHNWLQHYEYRITIQWWVFIATALATVLIALITVSFKAIKAAVENPIKSLRTE
jgi:putative ABC transport system permease protein